MSGNGRSDAFAEGGPGFAEAGRPGTREEVEAVAPLPRITRRSGLGGHVIPALLAIIGRETRKFLRQPGRLVSSVVRPVLWLDRKSVV